MKKIRTVFIDHDATYMNSFMKYLYQSREGRKIDLKMFTSEERFQKYIQQKAVVDLVLVGSPPNHSSIYKKLNCVVIYLDNGQYIDQNVNDFILPKFQPLNKLLSNIMAIYYENINRLGDYQISDQSKVISVFSSAGGTGKTMTAVQLSRHLALKNFKVIYLNLELYNTTQLFFQTPEDQHTSQILYYIKGNINQLMAKIEALKKKDHQSGVEYFDMSVSGEEMLELTKEEVSRLIECLKNTGNYDYIIIDLESSFHSRIISALQSSDYIFWILNPDIQSFFKTSNMLDELDTFFEVSSKVIDNSIFLLNGFTDKVPIEVKQFKIDIHGYLPFIPQWINFISNKQLDIPFISEEILNLIVDNPEQARSAEHA